MCRDRHNRFEAQSELHLRQPEKGSCVRWQLMQDQIGTKRTQDKGHCRCYKHSHRYPATHSTLPDPEPGKMWFFRSTQRDAADRKNCSGESGLKFCCVSLCEVSRSLHTRHCCDFSKAMLSLPPPPVNPEGVCRERNETQACRPEVCGTTLLHKKTQKRCTVHYSSLFGQACRSGCRLASQKASKTSASVSSWSVV